MVRDRFIAEQRTCGLRRHFDSIPPPTPIREILDRCREWESHADQNRMPPLGSNVGREHPAVASDSQGSSFYMEDPLMMDTPPVFEPKVPVSVVRDVVDGGAVFLGEWDRVVSDWSVNCAGLQEFAAQRRGLFGGGRGTEDHAAGSELLAQFISRRSCPRWWHVSNNQLSRKTRRRQRCLRTPKSDGSNSYHLRVHPHIFPYQRRGN